MRTMLAGLVLLVPGLGAAADTPAAGAPVAELSRVTGIARVQHAGSATPQNAVVGTPLAAGDKVIALAGRAEIKFRDGHLMRLSENTTVEIMGPQHPTKPGLRGTFTRLVQGSVRALVRGIRPNESFEIRSAQAIASVKGTDLVFDGGMATVLDQHDADKHVVQLLSIDEKVSMLINEGQSGGLRDDGTVVDPHPEDPARLEQLDRQFDVEGGAGGGAGQPSGKQATGEFEGNEDLHNELQVFSATDTLATLTDAWERSGDLTLKEVAYDRHGYRVRIEEYNRLATRKVPDDTIQTLILNNRDGGPQAGLTSFDDELIFNQGLPANFNDVQRNLPYAFRDRTVMPTYWVTEHDTLLTSPAGDFYREQSLFLDPVPLLSDFTRTFDTTLLTWNYATTPSSFQNGWGQSMEYAFWVGTGKGTPFETETAKEHYLWTEYGDIVGGWYAGVYHAPNETYQPGSYGRDGLTQFTAGTLTLWSKGPQVTGRIVVDSTIGAQMYPYDPDMMVPYLGDGNLYSTSSNGTPGLDNPYFGSGFSYSYYTLDGGAASSWVYGDGTHFDIASYYIDHDGHPIDWSTYITADMTYDQVNERLSKINEEVEVQASEFFDPFTGQERVIDLVIDPRIWVDAASPGPDYVTPNPFALP